MRKHVIPFRMMPASWGLVGPAYEEAEAHYNLSGEDLERKLIEIHHRDNPTVRALKTNDLDLQYRRIDSYAHATRKNELEYEDFESRALNQIEIDVRYSKLAPYDGAVRKVELTYGNAKTDEEKLARDLAMLEVEHEYGRIEKRAYDKRKATLENRPWVDFVESGFDPEKGLDSFGIELDYNPQWIEYLRLHGFVGRNDSQVLEDWFLEVCRSNAYSVDPNISVSLDPRVQAQKWNELGKDYRMGFDEDE